MKILIAPNEIAGYYANLAKGFKNLEIKCDYFTYKSHPFGYGGETKEPSLLKMAKLINSFGLQKKDHLLLNLICTIISEILIILWAPFAIIKYDVFIFSFGSSLIRGNLDIPILRMLNKTVISNLSHGSDARPPFINGAVQPKHGGKIDIAKLVSKSKVLKMRISFHNLTANFTLGSPLSTTHFSQSKIINSFAIGVPIQLSETKHPRVDIGYSNKVGKSDEIRIVHSPSHPAAKGSSFIISAIERLKGKGFKIDFVLVHGKPYAEVIDEIQLCDFVVDQIFSDTPMAGFATEAAWFGKPAVVGGYGFGTLRTIIPEEMWPPSKICHPDDVEQAIEDLIKNKEEREKLGKEAAMFVRQRWNAEAVASRYLRIIQNDIPDEWWLNPNDVCYLEGAGQSIERTKDNIRQMVTQYGVQSLQLSHRPALEKAFLDFAGINECQM